MNLFEYINASFTKENNEITKYEKSKHFFMYNRFLSIKYPNVANFLNVQKINASNSVDTIVRFLKKIGHKSTPKFFYTKTVSKEKNNIWYPKDKEQLMLYLNINGYSLKVFEDSLKFDPEGTKKDFEEFIKEIS
jgi:hypothetical protein